MSMANQNGTPSQAAKELHYCFKTPSRILPSTTQQEIMCILLEELLEFRIPWILVEPRVVEAVEEEVDLEPCARQANVL